MYVSIELEKEIVQALAPIMHKLRQDGLMHADIRGAIVETVYSMAMYYEVEKLGLPPKEKWKYDLKKDHIQNIKDYRFLFRVGLAEAKEVCDSLRDQTPLRVL